MSKIERKSFPILSLKAAAGEEGIVEAIVSVFNNVDHGKERVRPGAFTKSLERKAPKGVWCHNWDQPIAKTLEAKELPAGDPLLPEEIREYGGLYVKGQFNLATQRGREAYEDLKFGTIDEFSVGYAVLKDEKAASGVRDLLELDLYEWSPVLTGMNPATALLSVKDAGGETKADTAPETKGQHLGYWVEGDMTLAALREASNALFYHCFYDAVFNYDDEPRETRLANLRGGLEEFAALVLRAAEALLADDPDETLGQELKSLWPASPDPDPSSPGGAPAALPFETELKAVLATAQGCLDRGQAIQAKRAAEGRSLSKARGEQLQALAEALSGLASQCGAKPEPEAGAKADPDAVRRAQAAALSQISRSLGVPV